MIQQSKAKIFLAEDRGLNENKHSRSLHTFNFGNYFNKHKTPFNDIYGINDNTLDGGRSLSLLVQQCSYIILLPVIGAVNYKDSLGNENVVAAGQVQIHTVDKDVTIEITNPFKEHLVNFFQIWIKASAFPLHVIAFTDSYDVNKKFNSLVNIIPININEATLPFKVSVGKFNGRGETAYQLQDIKSGAFIFVLEGAFEIEGRLLHARDGLAIWETTVIEMEALSNDAILLLIETLSNKNQMH
ncbi:MAG TPA: pirin family protein [Chitinophagaceae bacterium]|jgi:quercetin 2,3-dioxygenase|nr:pirin family protein [Chitinophagaceae bacterium]